MAGNMRENKLIWFGSICRDSLEKIVETRVEENQEKKAGQICCWRCYQRIYESVWTGNGDMVGDRNSVRIVDFHLRRIKAMKRKNNVILWTL